MYAGVKLCDVALLLWSLHFVALGLSVILAKEYRTV